LTRGQKELLNTSQGPNSSQILSVRFVYFRCIVFFLLFLFGHGMVCPSLYDLNFIFSKLLWYNRVIGNQIPVKKQKNLTFWYPVRNYCYSTPNCKWRHFKCTSIFFFTVFTEYLIRLFRIISNPLKFCYFCPPDHVILMAMQALDFRCQYTQQKLQSICAGLTFDPQPKKILTFSANDRYQLDYFICIKDMNTETNTSLNLNLFLSLFAAVSIMKRKRSAFIYFWYQTYTEVPNFSIYSAVSLVSPYYNYL
jgi:hypothetical protein